jgi:SARP family transcriptional regulator, regulator of embCAB operon
VCRLECDPCVCWAKPNTLKVTLLGGFELRCVNVPVRLPLGAQRLVAFLAVQSVPLLRSHVGEALWPDSHRRRASANLRSALWRIRQAHHNVLDADSSRLSLCADVTVDVRERAALARTLLDRSASLPTGMFGPHTVTELSADLLRDWYDEWLFLERDRWTQLRLHALEALAEHLLAAGAYSEAVEAALAAVWAEPLRESANRILVRVYAAEGNLSEAVRQYHRYRYLLHRELKAPPTAQMEELIRALTPH